MEYNKELFNTTYKGYGKDRTVRAIFRDAYKDEYPEEAEPYSYVSKTELRRIVETFGIRKGQTIVDIGCGHGGPGLFVARGIGANLIGVDFSETAIQIANKRITEFDLEGKTSFVVGDFCKTGLGNANYDGAMSIDALIFVPDKIAAMCEVARILKKDAFFIFTTWENVTLGSLKGHRSLLEEAGFEVMVYEEPKGWKNRQRMVNKGILASKNVLIEEMTKSVAEATITDAEFILNTIDKYRRIFVVAQKK